MVRETRHLWVGNLPDNIREEKLRDHFKRHGRVQSIKVFARKGVAECENGLVLGECSGGTSVCAIVSFMDIKSAAKAHLSDHKLEEHVLTTEYHEPAPIPSALPTPTPAISAAVSASASPVSQTNTSALRHLHSYSSPRIAYGPDEITTFDTRSSHFFERRDGTDTYVRRPPSAAYVVSSSEPLRCRTRERDRVYRNSPTQQYTPILESVVARTPPASHHRSVTATGWSSFECTCSSRYSSSVVTTPEILPYQENRRESPVILVHKKHPKSRRKCRVMCRRGSNGSDTLSNNSDSSGSRSHTSSSSSHSRSSSSSDSSSEAISERSGSTHSHHGSLQSTITVHSTISTPVMNCSPVVHTDDRRPLAICVRNLPARSSDSSLKDGLYHEYKKSGKVSSVKISGQAVNSRYAIVYFKKADDVEKALLMSHDKLFFGSKIEVSVYQGYDVDDIESRPTETELDEYHPKATRTLFIGNLEKDVTVTDLRNTFLKFGEIIDIDIKKQGPTCYAFCQYCDISSVVKAMHAMDGEYLGINKINLGYGKSHATNCLWVAGVADCVTEKQLIGSFSQFGHVTHVHINRSQGKALVFFQQVTHAQVALSQMRGYVLKNRRLMADYASSECQEHFYESYEKSKTSISSSYDNGCQDSPQSTGSARGLDTPLSTTSSNSGLIIKHGVNAINGTNNINSNINCGMSSSKMQERVHHPAMTLYSSTIPFRQPTEQVPSSNCVSPVGDNTPSLSPSTSTRSTPHPQHTSRFDSAGCASGKRFLSRSLEDLNMSCENSEEFPNNRQEDVILQKERVSLLEQLNDYSSSDEEEVEEGVEEEEEYDDEVGKQDQEQEHEQEEELASIKHRNTFKQQNGGAYIAYEESRPGTPLCDERPENILAHYESRRAAKEKNTTNTPLSLPLPSFANKVPRSTSPSERFPRSHHQTKVSCRLSDSLRGSQLTNCTRRSTSPHLEMKLGNATSSFDTLSETLKAPWIEQLKSLDKKFEKWSQSRSKVLIGKLDTSAVLVKHKLLDVNAIGRQRSEICQTLLSRKSVFDDHFKRLEIIADQQSLSVDYVSPRTTAASSPNGRYPTLLELSAVNILPTLGNKPPFPPLPTATPPLPPLLPSSFTSSSSSCISPADIKGLQYPFPSHSPLKKSSLLPSPTSFPKVGVPISTTSKPPPSHPAMDIFSQSSSNPLDTGRCMPQAALLLQNNSVEKITDLPKTISPTINNHNMNNSRLVATAVHDPKTGPVSTTDGLLSRLLPSGVDSVTTSQFIVDEKNHKKRDANENNTAPVIANVLISSNSANSSSCSSSCSSINVSLISTVLATKSENSVLDKRKNITSMAVDECKNAVSVITHSTSHIKQKLSKSTENLSDMNKILNSVSNRRASADCSVLREDRFRNDVVEGKVQLNGKTSPLYVSAISHHTKINNMKPELTMNVLSQKFPHTCKHDASCGKSMCQPVNLSHDADKFETAILFNNVDESSKCLNGKNEERLFAKCTGGYKGADSKEKNVCDGGSDNGEGENDDEDEDKKNEKLEKEELDDNDDGQIEHIEGDEEDDESNVTGNFNTIIEKNRIIETVFHIKHEKKKMIDIDEKCMVVDEKKRLAVVEDCQKTDDDKGTEANRARDAIGEGKVRKECNKTTEFNMFGHEPQLEKKKSIFLLGTHKSTDHYSELEEDIARDIVVVKSLRDTETRDRDVTHEREQQLCCGTERMMAKDVEKKGNGKPHVQCQHKEKDNYVKQKSEELRAPTSVDSENHLAVESCGERKNNELCTKIVETKREMTIKPKEYEEDIAKEKKKDIFCGPGHPENGRITHYEIKRRNVVAVESYNGNHEHHSFQHQSENVGGKLRSSVEVENIADYNTCITDRNKISLDNIMKSFEYKDSSNDRKNSSGSSSFSDSLHCKDRKDNTTLYSFDLIEDYNNEDRKNHDPASNSDASHSSKKYDNKAKPLCSEDNTSNFLYASRVEKKNAAESVRFRKTEKFSNVVGSSSGSSGFVAKKKNSRRRKTSNGVSSSDSDFDGYEVNKKNHSIFDVVMDEPAYISMYDKVKARSTKNLQKQEEEKRQEKLKEKFSLLKQSRVKREEKKRSTSYEEDTDQERAVSRKGNKLILDSSDEEHSGNDKMKITVQPSDSSDNERMQYKKMQQQKRLDSERGIRGGQHDEEDVVDGDGVNDDDDDGDDEKEEEAQVMVEMVDGRNEMGSTGTVATKAKLRIKKVARRSFNANNAGKLKTVLTDTSEDELKGKQKRAEQFSFLAETKRKFKEVMSKKIHSDFSEDDHQTKILHSSTSTFKNLGERSDGAHLTLESRNKIKSNNGLKKVTSKYHHHHHHHLLHRRHETTNEENILGINDLKSKTKLLSDVSEEEVVQPKKGELCQLRVALSDVVDEGRINLEKLLSDTSDNGSINSNRFSGVIKKCSVYCGDGEHKVRKDKNDELYYNLSELHRGYEQSCNLSLPVQSDVAMAAGYTNELQKKKPHKKKQKRQKSREHSLDSLKRHLKKERRKSVPSDFGEYESKEKEPRMKSKKKKKNREKVKNADNLEEDIFGSMSDDSVKVLNNSYKLSKLSVSDVYDADSDSSNKDFREILNNANDMSKYSKVIQWNSDETKILNSVSSTTTSLESFFDHLKNKKKKRKKSKEVKSTKHHHHHHHRNHDSNRNHNHNHHHSKQGVIVKKEIQQVPLECPATSPPFQPPVLSLPCLDDKNAMSKNSVVAELEKKIPTSVENHLKVFDDVTVNVINSCFEIGQTQVKKCCVSGETHEMRPEIIPITTIVMCTTTTPTAVVITTTSTIANISATVTSTTLVVTAAAASSTTATTNTNTTMSNNEKQQMVGENLNKKFVLSIPAENVQERAVKSISDTSANTVSVTEPTREFSDLVLEVKPNTTRIGDEKMTTNVTISQEETEDAVAAILGESSSKFGFEERYQRNVSIPSTTSLTPILDVQVNMVSETCSDKNLVSVDVTLADESTKYEMAADSLQLVNSDSVNEDANTAILYNSTEFQTVSERSPDYVSSPIVNRENLIFADGHPTNETCIEGGLKRIIQTQHKLLHHPNDSIRDLAIDEVSVVTASTSITTTNTTSTSTIISPCVELKEYPAQNNELSSEAIVEPKQSIHKSSQSELSYGNSKIVRSVIQPPSKSFLLPFDDDSTPANDCLHTDTGASTQESKRQRSTTPCFVVSVEEGSEQKDSTHFLEAPNELTLHNESEPWQKSYSSRELLSSTLYDQQRQKNKNELSQKDITPTSQKNSLTSLTKYSNLSVSQEKYLNKADIVTKQTFCNDSVTTTPLPSSLTTVTAAAFTYRTGVTTCDSWFNIPPVVPSLDTLIKRKDDESRMRETSASLHIAGINHDKMASFVQDSCNSVANLPARVEAAEYDAGLAQFHVSQKDLVVDDDDDNNNSNNNNNNKDQCSQKSTDGNGARFVTKDIVEWLDVRRYPNEKFHRPVDSKQDVEVVPLSCINDNKCVAVQQHTAATDRLAFAAAISSASGDAILPLPLAPLASSAPLISSPPPPDKLLVDRNSDVDVALKQKLPIPAQQNTIESGGSITFESADHVELNEANKENIVKSVKKQENVSALLLLNEVSKLNMMVRNREREIIKNNSKSIEDEKFKSNEFVARVNLKTQENNRNILEKVVQRIHESKRVIPQRFDEGVCTSDGDESFICAERRVSSIVLTSGNVANVSNVSAMDEDPVNRSVSRTTPVKHGPQPSQPLNKADMASEFENPISITRKESSSLCGNDTTHPRPCPGGNDADRASSTIEEDEYHPLDNLGSKVNGQWCKLKRGRRRKVTTPSGVVTRRAKQNNMSKDLECVQTEAANRKVQEPSADVYEFKDDSEDEVKRPRLILTIKSPIEQSQPIAAVTTVQETFNAVNKDLSSTTVTSNNVAAAIGATSNHVPAVSSAKSVNVNTRKSRRLQEKGGLRSAVDDTIDEVVKTVQCSRHTRRMTRIAAAAAAGINTTVDESSRTKLRMAKKSIMPTATTTTTTTTMVIAAHVESVLVADENNTNNKDNVALNNNNDDNQSLSTTTSPSVSPATKTSKLLALPLSLTPLSPSSPPQREPTTLIDPVSGLLIPMKEAEEGQYVPFRADSDSSEHKHVDSPPEKKARLNEVATSTTTLAFMTDVRTAFPLLKSPSFDTESASVIPRLSAQQQQRPQPQPQPLLSSAIDTGNTGTVITSISICGPANTSLSTALPSLVFPTAVKCAPIVASKHATVKLDHEGIPSVVYSQPTSITKLYTSRILAPVTPKVHLLQAVDSENLNHPNVEASPSQYSTPLIHSALVSPPLPSPKVSPQPVIATINNNNGSGGSSGSSSSGCSRIVTNPIKKVIVPLEPLKIDPVSGFYYFATTSPQPLATLPTPGSSPQSGVIHGAPIAPSELLSHSTVQSGHYTPTQFMYQPFSQESSVTSFHYLQATPASHLTAASSGGGSRKSVADGDTTDGQLSSSVLSVEPCPTATATSAQQSSVLELPKKVGGAWRNLNDCTSQITSPYTQHTRPTHYDEPLQARRPIRSRIRLVSTPPCVSKVPSPSDVAISMCVPACTRQLDSSSSVSVSASASASTRCVAQIVPFHQELPILHPCDDKDDRNGEDGNVDECVSSRQSYTEISCVESRSVRPEVRISCVERHRGVDYTRKMDQSLCENAVLHSRDSSPSQMNSPLLGDSPPQGNLDGTVLIQMYPIIWQGLLALKNDQAAVQMHVISGNTWVAYDALPKLQDGYQPLLRIAQRMRLEQAQLDGVNRKMEIKDEHCTILGLPCGKNQEDVLQQASNLKLCIIPYLQQKKAAGIINTAAPGTQQAAFVVHVFPPCEFADNVLLNAAPDLYRKVQETSYLVCIIVTV